MKRLWPVVFPLVRPAVLTLAGVLAAVLVAVLALWGVRHFLFPGWQQAQATQQAAQGQLEEARAGCWWWWWTTAAQGEPQDGCPACTSMRATRR